MPAEGEETFRLHRLDPDRERQVLIVMWLMIRGRPGTGQK